MSVRTAFFDEWIRLMRSWGFTVHVAAGAHLRDASPRTSYSPGKMYVEHHDASTKLSGNWGALAYIIQNNLANIVTARDGQITVTAMGIANHAGVGSRPSLGDVPANGANYSSLGNEVANNGLGEPYSAACTRSIIAGQYAWALVSGQLDELRRILGHKEWADPPGRKSDPVIDMDQRRRDVAAFRPPAPPPPPPAPLAFPVTGMLGEAYRRILPGLNAPWSFFLGKPVGPGVRTARGDGYWQQFERGAIYAHGGRAHVLWGDILQKFWGVGNEAVIGYPVTDERATPDGIGRYNHFEGGQHGPASIYWHPRVGAHPVWGLFREVWSAAGWELGPLGYPTSGEVVVDGMVTQTFERGQLQLQPDGKVVTHPR